MARHLREQSGGDPRDQGPVPELANRPRSPRSDDDFPDAPEHDAPGRRGGDLTDEQLDDFAARLGLTDDAGETSDAASEVARADTSSRPRPTRRGDGPGIERVAFVVARPVGRVLIVVARVVQGTGSWLRSAGERLATSGSRDR